LIRTKPNWKVLDRLLPVLEQEGWSHVQITEDWGISLATLEGHLHRQEGPMAPPRRDIDWQRFDELKAQGLPLLRISAQMGIPEATLRQSAQRRERVHPSTPEAHQETPKAHPSTPQEPELWMGHPGTPEHTEISPDEHDTQEHQGTLEGHKEVMEDISQSVPDVPHIIAEETYQSIPEHPSTPEVHPEMSLPHSSAEHSGVPARQSHLMSTPMVHPGTPTEEDWELWAVMKTRWTEVEKMLADWQTRQALLSTPSGTPRHTMKKTYVVDSLYVELIDHYAKEHGLDLKDVLNLALQEFFERRDYQPRS
jgi:hypothetical protein